MEAQYIIETQGFWLHLDESGKSVKPFPDASYLDGHTSRPISEIHKRSSFWFTKANGEKVFCNCVSKKAA